MIAKCTLKNLNYLPDILQRENWKPIPTLKPFSSAAKLPELPPKASKLDEASAKTTRDEIMDFQ